MNRVLPLFDEFPLNDLVLYVFSQLEGFDTSGDNLTGFVLLFGANQTISSHTLVDLDCSGLSFIVFLYPVFIA